MIFRFLRLRVDLAFTSLTIKTALALLIVSLHVPTENRFLITVFAYKGYEPTSLLVIVKIFSKAFYLTLIKRLTLHHLKLASVFMLHDLPISNILFASKLSISAVELISREPRSNLFCNRSECRPRAPFRTRLNRLKKFMEAIITESKFA